MSAIRASRYGFALFVVLTVVNLGLLRAQSGTTSALSGVVTDPTGAVIPGAKLTLTFTSSGAQRTITTGAEGGFLFLQLTAGDYILAAEAPGFAASIRQLTYVGVPIHLNIVLSAASSHREVMVNRNQ